MNKWKSVALSLACYAIVILVCVVVWNWAVAGIVAGSIFLIDVVLCGVSGRWRWYFRIPKTNEIDEINKN